jgi:hypothetical protein
MLFLKADALLDLKKRVLPRCYCYVLQSIDPLLMGRSEMKDAGISILLIPAGKVQLGAPRFDPRISRILAVLSANQRI